MHGLIAPFPIHPHTHPSIHAYIQAGGGKEEEEEEVIHLSHPIRLHAIKVLRGSGQQQQLGK